MADAHTYKFNVTMSCGGCSGAVNRVLGKLEGRPLPSTPFPHSFFLPKAPQLTYPQAYSPTMSPSILRSPLWSPTLPSHTRPCCGPSRRPARRSIRAKQMARLRASSWPTKREDGYHARWGIFETDKGGECIHRRAEDRARDTT